MTDPKLDLSQVSLETWTYLYDASDNAIAPDHNVSEALSRIRAEATVGPCSHCGDVHASDLACHRNKFGKQPPLRTRAEVDTEIAGLVRGAHRLGSTNELRNRLYAEELAQLCDEPTLPRAELTGEERALLDGTGKSPSLTVIGDICSFFGDDPPKAVRMIREQLSGSLAAAERDVLAALGSLQDSSLGWLLGWEQHWVRVAKAELARRAARKEPKP